MFGSEAKASPKSLYFFVVWFSRVFEDVYMSCVFSVSTLLPFDFQFLFANMLQPVLCQIRFIIDVFTNIVLHDQSGPTKKEKHTQTTHTLTHTHKKKKKTDPAKCIKTAQKSANSESREIFEEVPNVCVCVKYR